MNWKRITTPLDESVIASLRTADMVLISGTLYTARDRAHARLKEMIEKGQELPFDPRGQVIYYTGPSPAPPGRPAGSAGPTTSARMDGFTEYMLKSGVRAFLGKGKRSDAARAMTRRYSALYLASFGGAGAYLGDRIARMDVIAFADLGAEAVFRIEVADFPAVVINDIHGGDLYEDALRLGAGL